MRLLDGAMGTEIIAAGLPDGALPEEWVLARPDAVGQVHARYVAAGAQVLFTCTFNATAPRLGTRGLAGRLGEVCARAVEIARVVGPTPTATPTSTSSRSPTTSAAPERSSAQPPEGEGRMAPCSSPRVLIAGALGPTALVRPRAAERPTRADLEAHYLGPFRALARAGADLLVAESQYDREEARAALAAGLRAGCPTLVSVVFSVRDGRPALPGDEPVLDCLRALADDGALAVGVNCVEPGEALRRLVEEAVHRIACPLFVKPSAGLPGALRPASDFAREVAALAQAGAALVGGCCGAGPEHVAALRRALGAAPEQG